MKTILESISKEMIRLAEFEYTEAQLQSEWFGNQPATLNLIEEAESKLHVTLPEDYKEFLLISDGFYAFNDVEPTFHTVETIDYLRNVDAELIQIWKEDGNEEVAAVLEQSIIVAGIDEEQSFLLIPPSENNQNWNYWKFASWIPGEELFDSLKHYFEDALDFMKESE